MISFEYQSYNSIIKKYWITVGSIQCIQAKQNKDWHSKLVYQFPYDYQDHHSQLLLEIASLIESGAAAFLVAEYRYIGVVIILVALLIFYIVEPVFGQVWTTVALLVGTLTSIISRFIGMGVATFFNDHCAYCALHIQK